MSGADRDGRGMDYLRPFLPGLESVLEDEDVSEIMINGPGNVWVERRGEIREHPAPGLDGAALDRAAIQIARPLGLDPATAPILDARLDDGSRVAICVPPAAPHVAITIRHFGKRSFSPEDLVRFGSLPLEVLDAARAALLGRRNILVSGGTGSGKTTLLNALVELLPADDRIVSIEDTLELRIDRKNCVRFEARGIDGESVTIRDLVKHALRHRPDHIVVGEVRGGEAADLLQALNTGHGGSLTTIHANNAESALSRLATCAMQGETDLPWEVTCRGVVDGISMVIHMTRREGKRYVEEALHVGDYDAAKRRWHYRPVVFAVVDREEVKFSRHAPTGRRPGEIGVSSREGLWSEGSGCSGEGGDGEATRREREDSRRVSEQGGVVACPKADRGGEPWRVRGRIR